MKLEISESIFQVISVAIIVRSVVMVFIETVAPKIK